jgi:protein-S-isoprenylcysteine O-methyltransferase Ste14
MIPRSVLLGLLIFNYASYCLSIVSVFRTYPDRKKIDYRLLQIASVAIWITSLFEVANFPATNSTAIFSIAIILELGFGALYWWAARIARRKRFTIAYSLDAPESIVREGPYRFIRHPCYTAYLGSYFTAALSVVGPWSLIMSIVVLGIYWRAARLEEQKFRVSTLASQYTDYEKKTGMFFPKIYR